MENWRFQYGRHETFAVRYGWLGKGLSYLQNVGPFRGDVEVADRLGLGSKMAKSLQFWLEATGLAEPVAENSIFADRHSRRKVWRITPFGKQIRELDPHCEYPGTWWFMHMVLARRSGTVWGWFFNEFHERQFLRKVCVESFRRYAMGAASNPPSLAMAQRDVACLLQAYGSVHGSVADPEDATVCPFRELGLLIRHQDSDRFEKVRPLHAVPAEAFLACASDIAEGNRVPLTGLMSRRNGPARIFGLGRSQIEGLVQIASDLYPSLVQIDLLGAERCLVLPSDTRGDWLKRHFARIRTVAVAA